MTQPTSTSIIKAIAFSKPTISKHRKLLIQRLMVDGNYLFHIDGNVKC